MSSIGMLTDISALIEATASGNRDAIVSTARALLLTGSTGDVLLGRLGMIAAHADSDGHAILILSAAATICRWQAFAPRPVETDPNNHEYDLPVVVQALTAVAPAIRAGQADTSKYPEPFFPSELPENKTLEQAIDEAIAAKDRVMLERLLLGLYGTGADYRAMQARIYQGLALTFQREGHPFIFAARGTQLLDTVEWGDRVPNILHWMTQHMVADSEQPAWLNDVITFANNPENSLAGLRVRLSQPKDTNALGLRNLILSDASTPEVCKGVFETLVTKGASSRATAAMISQAAADLLQQIKDEDREGFVQAAHGLLFASAVHSIFAQVQEVEVLPVLFTAAAYINALRKKLGQTATAYTAPSTQGIALGGGLIAPTILEGLRDQLHAGEVSTAFATATRYRQLGYDERALFAMIGLVAAESDATADEGHSLQIVQAAGEEYQRWPETLGETNHDSFLHIALRAAAFGKRA